MTSTSQASEDEVLFELTKLPYDIQRVFTTKLDLSSFSILRNTSKSMRSVCDDSVRSGYLPPICFEYCNVYDVVLSCEHNNKFSKVIVPRPRRHGMVTIVSRNKRGKVVWENVCEHYRNSIRRRVLAVNGEVSCSPEVFNSCLQNHSIEELYLKRCSSDFNRFLHLPAVKKLTSLSWMVKGKNCVAPIYTSLLSLRALVIDLPCCDLQYIYSFLKDWKEGQRDFWRFTIHTVKGLSFGSRDDFITHLKHEILSRLDAFNIAVNFENEFVEAAGDDVDRAIQLRGVLARPPNERVDVFFHVDPRSRDAWFDCEPYLADD